MPVIEVIKAIENETNKEIHCISFYKTGEVKELMFETSEWFMDAGDTGCDCESCNSNEPV